MNVPAECLSCGVCCFSKSATCVRVSGADWSRLGGEADRVAHFFGQRAYMRMEDDHCIALQITAEPGQPAVFFCSIYEQRPQVCRDLRRSSMECEGELSTKAHRVAERHGA